ncbi:MAG TPA: protein translocase subunit SecD [Candidatus Saccharimonadales bacterium]|nr:protein translocase subunit SecD [Candidatus Saccharimonadales bacterium]
MSLRVKFFLILLLTVVTAGLAYPREGALLKRLGLGNANLQLRQGLDLQGGAHLVYQADTKQLAAGDKAKAMDALVDVIQKRVNPSGTSEINVQTASGDRVIVELPGVKDLGEAKNTIGKTAQLSFLEMPPAPAGQPAMPLETGITGKDVDRAEVTFDPTSGAPVVSLRLKSGEATKRFAEVTTKINQTGSQLVTLLDQDVVFGPATVSTPITDGNAQLQGNFSVAEAKQIAQLINAGALPVPVELVEQRTVGATLGQESVARSIVAGLIGLSVVAAFMMLYYRLAGALAVAALAIYTLLTLALYKLSALTPYPIVLTLAGIAGFILSIGMAVDANILIFERMKEELRAGKSFTAAIEAGFDRAWTSIRDSNVSTLITTVILYQFGAPIIKGFAVTLGLGVIVSMFTAVVVSRTLLRMMIRTKLGRQPRLYGLKAEAVG